MKTNLLDWLRAHPLINIHGLEKEAGAPPGTIKLALRGDRDLPQHRVGDIEKVLKKYGWQGNWSNQTKK
jgi:hypothetical protein